MSHSSYVYLGGDEIILPPFLTQPLNLDPSNLLVGLYYPTPASIKHEEYADTKPSHDIIFTPIPYAVWPFSVCITVRLREKRGVVAQLTEWLEKNDINIINTNSCRSGNRHFLFRAYGFFEDLYSTYNREILSLDGNLQNIIYLREKLSKEIEERSLEIKNELIRDSDEQKFNESNYLYNHKRYLNIHPIDSMSSHFWDMREEHHSEYATETGWTCLNPYVFQSSMNDRNGVKIPSHILSKISLANSKDGGSSTDKKLFWGLAHVDEANAQIRTTLISESEFERFHRFEIEYSSTRMGSKEPHSTKGLLNICSSVVSQCGYNIFSITSNNWQASENSTAGSIHYLVESTRNPSLDKKDLLKERLVYELKRKWKDELDVKVRPRSISPYRFFISISNHSEYRETILDELIKEVGPQLGLIEADQNFIIISSTGTITPKEVQTGIQDCDGVIQFCEHLNEGERPSVWLEVETFAARTLEKPVLYVYVSSQPDEPGKREKALNSLPRTEVRSEPEYYDINKPKEERLQQLYKTLDSLITKIDKERGYRY